MAWTRETPGGGWKGIYRDPAGNTRSRSFGKNEKGKARKWAADQEAAIRGGSYVEPKSGKATLGELYDELHVARPYAPATVRLHAALWGDPGDEKHPLWALRHRKAGTITRKDIDDALAKVTAPTMQRATRLLLSAVFTHAIDMEKVHENPARTIRKKTTRAEKMAERKTGRPKRYLEDDELERLAGAVPKRYAALVRLQGRVGLRPGEALALTVGKFDPMHRKLTIDTSVSGFTKTGEARTVTLPSVIVEQLAAHLTEFSRPTDPAALMFPTEGGMLSPGGWHDTFVRAVVRAGLPEGLTPNDLRHSAVSWAIGLGATIYSIQEMVGHARPSITLDVYGSLWKKSAEDLAERQDEALRALAPPTEAAIVSIR